MPIKKHPRLIIEVPRNSKRYKKVKVQRSTSERTNGHAKDYVGLGDLRLWGNHAYAVRVILVCIEELLKKIILLIIKITMYITDYALGLKIYAEPNSLWLEE